MRNWLQGWLGRNRGLTTALAVVALILTVFLNQPPPRPRVSWTEPDKTSSLGATNWPYSSPAYRARRETAKFSPDGRALLTSVEQTTTIRDLKTGKVTQIPMTQGPAGLLYPTQLVESEWMEDGRLLVGILEGADGLPSSPPILKVWDVPSGRQRFEFPEPAVGPFGLVQQKLATERSRFLISADGSTLAYLTGHPVSRSIGIWRGERDWTPRDFPGVGPFTVSANGHFLAAFESANPEADLFVWDVNSSEKVATIHRPSTIGAAAIALAPDGKRIAESQPGEVIVWDVATPPQSQILTTETTGLIRFSSDGQLLFHGPLNDRDPNFGRGPTRTEIWEMNAIPPKSIFRGVIADLSRDGHRIIQSGPNLNEAGTPANGLDPIIGSKVVDLPSMKERAHFPNYESFFESERKLSLDGKALFDFQTRFDATWLDKLIAWIQSGFKPTSPTITINHVCQLIDSDSGRVLNSIDFGQWWRLVDEYQLVDGGKTLAIRSKVLVDPLKSNQRENVIELWDVPGPSSPLPWVCGSILVALGLGGWYDRRAKRRAASISLTSAS